MSEGFYRDTHLPSLTSHLEKEVKAALTLEKGRKNSCPIASEYSYTKVLYVDCQPIKKSDPRCSLPVVK